MCSIIALIYQLVVLLRVRVSIGEKLSDSGTVMFCFGQATKQALTMAKVWAVNSKYTRPY